MLIAPREEAIAAPPRPIASAAWRTVHAIRDAVGGDVGSAIRWSPRNTAWLYLIAIGVGVGLSALARFALHMIPNGRVTVVGTVVTVLCMGIGALVGLFINQRIDLRRRGVGTIAARCPRTLGGLLSIELSGLVLKPMTPLNGMLPPVQIAREQIASVAARRTHMLQIELSATFVDGSTACWYVPITDPLARAWVERSA